MHRHPGLGHRRLDQPFRILAESEDGGGPNRIEPSSSSHVRDRYIGREDGGLDALSDRTPPFCAFLTFSFDPCALDLSAFSMTLGALPLSISLSVCHQAITESTALRAEPAPQRQRQR